MGFFFFKRTNASTSIVTVKESTARGTADVDYELIQIIEFTSTRKRQSVIVKDNRGKYLLFCKGADTVIYERLAQNNPQNQRFKDPTTKHMEEYGSAGLRTLCLAYAEIPPQEFAEWNKRLFEAKTSMVDRAAKEAEVNESIEKDLILLGCTAIEDKLQEGVPKCIATLAEAGIRLWVLTGDKMETAINIGFACSLITEDMKQFIITADFKDVEELEHAAVAQKDKAVRDRMLRDAHNMSMERVKSTLLEVEAEMDKATGGRKDEDGIKFAMVINGKALAFALEEGLAKQFLKVGLRCQAVICCRVSPAQKGDVTALVRSYGDITLAIGDGANDVPMIQKVGNTHPLALILA
jgi:phospholipid-transporting ATPase